MGWDISTTAVTMTINLSFHLSTIFILQLVQDQVDMARVTVINPSVEDRLLSAFECVKETVEEFTDSYYTSHDAREKIVQLSDNLRDDLQAMLLLGQNLVQNFNFFRGFLEKKCFIAYMQWFTTTTALVNS